MKIVILGAGVIGVTSAWYLSRQGHEVTVITTAPNFPEGAVYDGYGSCPLTVERGKIVLAEFGFGGKLLPTFPLDPAKPRKMAWHLKKTILPWLYWNGMLKGREWLAKPVQN